MPTYTIPIQWVSIKDFDVEANNLQEALQLALDNFMSIPDNNYLEDSVSFDEIGIIERYPDENFNLHDLI